MVSNQEKVMIIRKKSVANPVKSRFAKKSQKISTHFMTEPTKMANAGLQFRQLQKN